MLAISLKKNEINFISVFKQTNQLNIEDYGSFKSNEFKSDQVAKIKNRKKIKNTQNPSKKVMLFLDVKEVVINQFNYPKEISLDDFLDWYNHSMFGNNKLTDYSSYHYEMNEDKFLSIYIKKEKQFEYHNILSSQSLELKAISLGIFSADYLARSFFEADSKAGYMVWSVGKETDEILIARDGSVQCVFTLNRNGGQLSLVDFMGCKEIVDNAINMLNDKMKDDLKSFDVVDKIYMYKKSSGSDIKKIYNKKNKESITILNPLIKMQNFNKKKMNILDSSYLAEMGYIFKTLDKS